MNLSTVLVRLALGEDEFESKVGQFIYTTVMYERLKEHILERTRARDRVSLRIDLGKDKTGKQYVMDIFISPLPEKLKVPVGEPEPIGVLARKFGFIAISNNVLLERDNAKISKGLEEAFASSFQWWHGHPGNHDRIALDSWKTEDILVLDAPSASITAEIPIEKIIVPEKRKQYTTSEHLDKLKDVVDFLTPICVRPSVDLDGYYELVYGHARVLASRKAGKSSINAIVRHVSDDEAEKMWNEDEKKWANLLNNEMLGEKLILSLNGSKKA